MNNKDIWIFIFLLGMLGLNWPIIEIFHPNEIAYLFFFWIIFILLIFLKAFKADRI